MASDNFGTMVFSIAAIILAMSTLNIFNQQENFGAIAGSNPADVNTVARYTGGPSLTATNNLENYQDSIVMNIGTSVEDVNKSAGRYYANLQSYLNPSIDNLELAQNISARNIQGGVPLPGASSSYRNNLGDGYMSNVGHLGGMAFPPVAYQNDRAAQLSQCAKDLPMFAASSLLPKPSVNADNNALSQSAARALAAFTALSPVEQIGGITSDGTPYSKTSDLRALDQISMSNVITPVFGASSSLYNSPTFGQVQSGSNVSGPSGLVNN